MMKFRDNSGDDIRYDRLEDEKSLLEYHTAAADQSCKHWRRSVLVTYALTLALLIISVVFNIIGWRELSKIHHACHSHLFEKYSSYSLSSTRL